MGEKTDRKEIIRKVREFKESIKKRFSVESMIIFGSVARGRMTEHSDVDIIVVSGKYGTRQFFKVVPMLYNEWHLKSKIGYPVDFLLYNKREFNVLKKKVSIVGEALREGIEI